jgi:serine protease
MRSRVEADRRCAVVLVIALVVCGLIAASTARAAAYLPGVVVVGYERVPSLSPDEARLARASGSQLSATASAGAVVRTPRGVSVATEIRRLRHRSGVTYAVPDFVAHAAGSWIPNDPGTAHVRGGWQKMQWNFLPVLGVNAPQAWANLRADGRAGGRGVVVAVLDTGVAYRNWHRYRRSPDFGGTKFVHPYDFVAKNPYPLDREGHGTFVAGMIAEATNNGIGLTGLAYGASIMPVRVLNAAGAGDAITIAKGIRYAVNHGAQVINMSLEFGLDVTSSDIPEVVGAVRFAHRRGVVVVASAGNEGVSQLAYPAAAPDVISVGATTKDRCLADYSNGGPQIDRVAPGGGDDASLSDNDCNPYKNLPSIYQMTLTDSSHPARFGYPGYIYGTSMSSPEVAATAALVIASRVLGRHPTPQAILKRLEDTATPLDGPQPNSTYGWGLLNAGAATASRSQAQTGPTGPTGTTGPTGSTGKTG